MILLEPSNTLIKHGGDGLGGLRYHLPATCSAALRTLPRWLNRLAGRRGGGGGGGGATPDHTWVSPYQHNKAPLLAGWGKLWYNLQGCFLSFAPQWWVNTWDALSDFFPPGVRLLTLPVNVDRSSPPMTLISPVDWSFWGQGRWITCFFFLMQC